MLPTTTDQMVTEFTLFPGNQWLPVSVTEDKSGCLRMALKDKPIYTGYHVQLLNFSSYRNMSTACYKKLDVISMANFRFLRYFFLNKSVV